MKKEIRNNQALSSHILNFDQVQKKMAVPTSRNPIDPAAGSKVFMPGAVNTPAGKPYENYPGCRILENGKAEITFFAPEAKRVEIAGIGGSMQGRYDLAKIEDGYWRTVLEDVRDGFHYCVFIVDGVMTYSPVMPFGFGCGYVMNYFEVPLEDEDFYLLKDVPHGDIHMNIVKSEIAGGRYRNLWVYTPAGYEKSTKKYPVMHILHGGGENEIGWFWEGKLNYIADNLIAEGKCEEMIIVASSFAAPIEMEDGTYMAGNFADVMCKEIVPYIDEHYRTISDREHRAMAGLSAGGGVARQIAHNNPQLFASLGQFSSGGGFAVDGVTTIPGGYILKEGKLIEATEVVAPKYDELFQSPEHYNSLMKCTFITCGTDDPRHKYTEPQVKEFIEKGYNFEYACYPGYHEWDVWRFSARDYMMRLFK